MLLESLKKIPGYVNYLFKGFYLPAEVLLAGQSGEKVILHLSDTPSFTYRAIYRLVQKLDPAVIIHTGDLADDIKLELNPNCSYLYKETVKTFLGALERTGAEKIYIVPGNHDMETFLREKITRAQVVSEGTIITLNGRRIGLAHALENVPFDVDIGLYGHNFERPEKEIPPVLNGVDSINIIMYPSWAVHRIPYPVGTNQERKYGIFNGRLP